MAEHLPGMHRAPTSAPLKKGGEERDGSALKALATEPDGLTSFSETHMVDGESRLLKVVHKHALGYLCTP